MVLVEGLCVGVERGSFGEYKAEWIQKCRTEQRKKRE